jgi:hypothetical protein
MSNDKPLRVYAFSEVFCKAIPAVSYANAHLPQQAMSNDKQLRVYAFFEFFCKAIAVHNSPQQKLPSVTLKC